MTRRRKKDDAAPDEQSERRKLTLTKAQLLGAEVLPEVQAQEPMTVVKRGDRVVLDPKLPYSIMAETVANAIPDGALYRHGGGYVTLHKEGDRINLLPIDKDRFSTWVERYVYPCKHTDEGLGAPTSLSPAQCAIILASDALRERVPELEQVSYLRLPVGRCEGGKWRFRPVVEGYDPESKTYTVDACPIDWSEIFPLDEAKDALIRIFSEFPLDGEILAKKGGIDRTQAFRSRSLGACVAAMLGQFLRLNIDLFPMIVINANQVSTGKSFLAKVIMSPVNGIVASDNYIEDENEFRKSLNTMVFEGQAVCYLDDIRTLVSNVLNRFVTSPKVHDRILGTNKTFDLPNRMQFFVTGNQLKASPDVVRRSMNIDLFFSERATDRVFQGIVTEEMLDDPKFRSYVLRLLWSLVKHWEMAGSPKVPHKVPLSFGRYADLAINIACWAGFCDPGAPALVDMDSGDAIGDAMIRLVTCLADFIQPGQGATPLRKAIYRVSDIARVAERLDILDIITLGARDQTRSIGAHMRRFKGRTITDHWGRKVMISDKRTAACSTYPFTVVEVPADLKTPHRVELPDDRPLISEDGTVDVSSWDSFWPDLPVAYDDDDAPRRPEDKQEADPFAPLPGAGWDPPEGRLKPGEELPSMFD